MTAGPRHSPGSDVITPNSPRAFVCLQVWTRPPFETGASGVSLNARLTRLERILVPAVPLVPDFSWALWIWFREVAFAVLEEGGFAKALALVRERVSGNEPHVFPGKGPSEGDEFDARLWVMTETVWHALRDDPAAFDALESALEPAFEEYKRQLKEEMDSDAGSQG
jgi:hypothetical protein